MTQQSWLIIGITLVCAVVLTRVLRVLITRSFNRASETLKVDPTRYTFSKNAISLVVWLVALGVIVLTLPELKALAVTLFAGAGILVAILGFAAQHALGNVVSGIFIVIFRPFRVGDLIQVGSLEYGEVVDINLRHTVIRSFENKRIIIPNSLVSAEVVTNDSIEDERICKRISVTVGYSSDVPRAMELLAEVCANHPLCIDARTAEDIEARLPKVAVRARNLADSGIDLMAFAWTPSTITGFKLSSEVLVELNQRYIAEGIEIPFPHRTVLLKHPSDEPTS